MASIPGRYVCEQCGRRFAKRYDRAIECPECGSGYCCKERVMTPHPDWQALLAAVIQNPDDDLIRLQVADWLEERGESEQAEFIRVQVELADLDRRLGGCDREDERDGCHPFKPEWKCLPCQRKYPLRGRMFDLWTGGAGNFDGVPGEWCPTIYGSIQPPGVNLTRGFVSQVACTWTDWQTHADALLAACPLKGRDGLVRLSDYPQIERLSIALLSDPPKAQFRVCGKVVTVPHNASSGDVLKARFGVRFELPRETAEVRLGLNAARLAEIRRQVSADVAIRRAQNERAMR